MSLLNRLAKLEHPHKEKHKAAWQLLRERMNAQISNTAIKMLLSDVDYKVPKTKKGLAKIIKPMIADYRKLISDSDDKTLSDWYVDMALELDKEKNIYFLPSNIEAPPMNPHDAVFKYLKLCIVMYDKSALGMHLSWVLMRHAYTRAFAITHNVPSMEIDSELEEQYQEPVPDTQLMWND